MENGTREYVVNYFAKNDMNLVELCTSDTHFSSIVVRTRTGYYPFGKISKPETIATAIRIGNPASWKQAIAAKEESKGRIEKVTDEQILSAYHLLAEKEGVFVEPSSAAGVAGLIMLKEKNELMSQKVIVITVTGNGLKDVNWVLDHAPQPTVVPVDVKRAAEVIGLA